MFERKIVLDPGAWSMKIRDARNKRSFETRSCIYKDKEETIPGSEALQAYWDKGKSALRYPISQGEVIGDIEPIFSDLLEKSRMNNGLLKPTLLVVLPQEVQDQKEMWLKTATDKGFRKVQFASTMDILASDLDLDTGLVIHAGYSCTEIAVYYAGRQVQYAKIMYGGREADEKIAEYLANHYKSLVMLEDAAELKERASKAFWQGRNPRLGCAALDYTNTFVRLEFPALELWPAIQSVEEQIVLWARNLTSRCTPSILESVLENPIRLSGGMAECFGLQQMLEDGLSAQVEVVSDPEQIMLESGVKHLKS